MLPDVSHKRVLFVGERIKDVYHYGRLIGRPPKEPIICIEQTGSESYEGGVIAASEHAKSFVGSIEVFSTKELVKERFVESNRYRKLFEVYSGHREIEAQFPDVSSFDAVVVTDYGHGMMTSEIVERVCSEAKFLAVNVQTNSGNFGFNLATKYPRVDYLCVDEIEARLATQNPFDSIEESLLDLSIDISPKVVITLGRNGAVGFNGTTHRAQAFAGQVVDTMGAGDAFFAVTACMANELDIPDLLRIGNAAGALKKQNLGQKPVNKNDLIHLLAH